MNLTTFLKSIKWNVKTSEFDVNCLDEITTNLATSELEEILSLLVNKDKYNEISQIVSDCLQDAKKENEVVELENGQLLKVQISAKTFWELEYIGYSNLKKVYLFVNKNFKVDYVIEFITISAEYLTDKEGNEWSYEVKE